MAEGFAIQLDAETGCAIRIFPDVHVNTPTGNIRSALPLATEGTQESGEGQGAGPHGDGSDG